MKFYSLCQKVLSCVIRTFFRIEKIGEENEPTEGAFLVCSNHISMWDPVMIGSCMKRQVHFMAKEELFHIPFVRLLIKSLGAFPVKRGSNDIGAIKNTISLLKSGECVGIFPQGTRKKGVDARDTEVKAGAGMCVYHAKADILPVAVVTKKRRMTFLAKTYLIIGKPIKFEDLDFSEGTREQFDTASRLMFNHVCDLIDANYPRLK